MCRLVQFLACLLFCLLRKVQDLLYVVLRHLLLLLLLLPIAILLLRVGLVAGILVEKVYRLDITHIRRIIYTVLSMAAGLFCCYALGMVWFMYLTGSGLFEGLLACVVPFLPGDGLKIALAAVLIDRLRKIFPY